jgi:type IV pilus assembly protein PilM
MIFEKPFGLDISQSSIKLVSLSGSLKKPKLLAMGKIFFEKDFKGALEKLIFSPPFGKLETKKFIFSLPEEKTFSHFFYLPENLKGTEILDFIKKEAERTFPFELKELYFDYLLDGKEVILVAFQKEIVDFHLRIFEEMKLKPIAMESESLSLKRSLLENEKSFVLIFDFGQKFSNFIAFSRGKLKFSDSIEVGGEILTNSLAKNFGISFEKAEKMKRKIGLNPEKEEGKVFHVLQKEIQSIIFEIEKIEKFLKNKIEKIILTGGGAALPFLKEYLSENLGCQVSISDPWNKIDIEILKKKEYFKEALKINPYSFSTAIGLALRGLEKNPKRSGINLIKELK